MMDFDGNPSRLGRFLCRFGIHMWSIWRVRDDKPWYQRRRCGRCGKTQEGLV